MSTLDKLLGIHGVTWTWNEQARALGHAAGAPEAGVVAQEVEATFPELVATVDGVKRVNYTALIGVLVEAVKELKAECDGLRARVDELERAVTPG